MRWPPCDSTIKKAQKKLARRLALLLPHLAQPELELPPSPDIPLAVVALHLPITTFDAEGFQPIQELLFRLLLDVPRDIEKPDFIVIIFFHGGKVEMIG